MSLFEIRREYEGQALDESHVAADPVAQFGEWMQQAIDAKLPEPTAMTLATADADGRPGARIVLLKDFSENGFTFFTNYDSRKGRELAANPRACLLFYWAQLFRQVRIDGVAERVSRDESVAYFRTRPRGSQLGAWASEQSAVLPSRQALERRLEERIDRFPDGREIDMPPHWGGYRLKPDCFEFWQGRPSRLHDRIQYIPRPEGAWTIQRLAP